MARVLAPVGYAHFEADMFFVVDGVYRYDPSRIRDAHAGCQRKTREALALGRRVVVSNTFTRLQEMEPYRSMTPNVRVIEATGRWQNVHGVPNERLRQMAERWQSLPDRGALFASFARGSARFGGVPLADITDGLGREEE